MQQQQNLKPQFKVKPVPVKERTKRHVRKIIKMSERDRSDDGEDTAWEDEFSDDKRDQYDVFFPSGCSMRVIGKRELKRLGLAGKPGIVDMDTGDVQPEAEPLDLEEHVKRTTKSPRSAGFSA